MYVSSVEQVDCKRETNKERVHVRVNTERFTSLQEREFASVCETRKKTNTVQSECRKQKGCMLCACAKCEVVAQCRYDRKRETEREYVYRERNGRQKECMECVNA